MYYTENYCVCKRKDNIIQSMSCICETSLIRVLGLRYPNEYKEKNYTHRTRFKLAFNRSYFTNIKCSPNEQ